MAKVYEVKNFKEALITAQNFQSEGKYNLFRGQARNWKVIPSIGRLSERKFHEVKEKLIRLYYYLGTNSTLKKFQSNIDWFYAVAQHYGIPTNYIDFTNSVEIALYFATNSKVNKTGEYCSIICLNEEDFNRFIKVTKFIYENDKVIPPYIAKVNVDNLWRLQAQHGCFLFTPYADIEFYYDFDKIIFPFTTPFEGLSTQQIYPDRKSELEILLDHYFNSEKRLEGQKRMQHFAEVMNIPITNLPAPDFNSIIKKKSIHNSWRSANFKKWCYPITEKWNTIDIVYTISLNLSSKDGVHTQIQSLAKQLEDFFINNNVIRTAPLQFDVATRPKLNKRLSKIINRSCARIWDGTRNLPYTDAEIFLIISKYICLEIQEDKLDYTPSLSGEELILLELTNTYGSVTRCKVSPSKVVSTFREDINDILIDELTSEISSEILLHINIPNLLFDFKKLIQLFKDEMISYQVLYNSEHDNPVIFYTPSQISIMGYA